MNSPQNTSQSAPIQQKQQQQHQYQHHSRYLQQQNLSQTAQKPKDGGSRGRQSTPPVLHSPVATTTTSTTKTIANSSSDSQPQSSMAYQHKHALHRLRRLKKRSPHRNLVIGFVPRLRISIINRLDFFNRYSKQEQEVLSCFDFLDELVPNYCDEGLEMPCYSPNLYEKMIQDLI